MHVFCFCLSDKFYCKLHFAQCKTNNTHKKRRSVLKTNEKVCVVLQTVLSNWCAKWMKGHIWIKMHSCLMNVNTDHVKMIWPAPILAQRHPVHQLCHSSDATHSIFPPALSFHEKRHSPQCSWASPQTHHLPTDWLITDQLRTSHGTPRPAALHSVSGLAILLYK